MTDLLIIGGGAAGLMAAGAACARGLTTAVVEHNPKGPGQKLLITGKGRCNVTNDCDVREFLNYVRHNPRFLYSALYAFSPASAMELFESLGVPLKTERGRRVFPVSDKAEEIRQALSDTGNTRRPRSTFSSTPRLSNSSMVFAGGNAPSDENRKRGFVRTWCKNSSAVQSLVTLQRPLPVTRIFWAGLSMCSSTVT